MCLKARPTRSNEVCRFRSKIVIAFRHHFLNEQTAGLILVLILHGAALYALWQHRLIPSPAEAATVFVNFISPPPPPEKKPHRVDPPKPVKLEKPRPVEPPPPPQQLLVEAPVEHVAEPVAPPPTVVVAPVEVSPPAPPAPPPPAPKPAGPVTLPSELSLACPDRKPPSYPAISRRLGEEGKVVLRVELDEEGRISTARVASSSGYGRLDETALAAIRSWRCQPAQRNGQPVRAVAMQPFNFVLEGR